MVNYTVRLGTRNTGSQAKEFKPKEERSQRRVMCGSPGRQRKTFMHDRATVRPSLAADFLSRASDVRVLWGTGVGAFLNVHEGPHGLSQRKGSDECGFQAGMTLSNEPGYYEDGAFGASLVYWSTGLKLS